MLDGLLHRNTFRAKCKTALTRTKTRLEVIKKKRNAMQKFLKKDIADLLKSSLDRNAYGRAEGLYNEINLTSCYDYVEQCCACISEHLKAMHKERECPEECKVAVSSLVYAAARFADLPELRDLRNQFSEKYGKILDPFVSKEFVDKLKSKPPTMEMKLQLMQEIAQEFSIIWDSLPLQQQMHTQGIEKPTKLGSEIDASDKMLRSRSTAAEVKVKQEEGKRLMNQEQKQKVRTRRHNSYSGSNGDISEILQQQSSVQEENNLSRKPFTNRIVPAPYTISDEHGSDARNEDIASRKKEDSNPNLRYDPGATKIDLNRQKEKNDDDDYLFSKAKPRPRSVRTKFLKQSVSSATSSSEHEIDAREIKSARIPQERRHAILSDDEEDEEEVAGKWKTHYSTKRPPKTPSSARNSFPTSPENEDSGTPKSALPPPPGRRRYLFAEPQSADSDGQPNCETPSSSGRSKFLPPDFQEPDSPIEPKMSPIRHVKSESFLNDGHVHPRMPSFDELAERVAALRKI